MRKIMLILISVSAMLTYSAEKVEKNGIVGVYNVLNLGKIEKDYKHLSKAIEPFDIVGLVEVMNKKGLNKLVSELDKNTEFKWSYTVSPYPVGTKKYKEYYAYVYKKDRVKFIRSEGFYPDEANSFIREPYGATFKIDNFDFTFILLHTIYGKKITERQYEAMKLVDVYDYFQDLTPKENDIIIAGDFNLPANNSAFEKLLSHEDEIIYALDPTLKTTIGTKGFANSYDNMFVSKIYTKEFEGKSGAIDTTRGNYLKNRKEVSDHLPVFIIVNTEFDDD